MSISNLPQRVERGVTWCDIQHLRWWEKVDLNTLNMASNINHLLAQIHGSKLATTYEFVSWTHEQLCLRGFSTHGIHEDYVELTEAWVVRIRELRQERL